MRRFALHYPLIFSLMLALALFGLMLASRLPFPTVVVGDVGDLTPEQIQQPTELEQAFSTITNAETLYLALTVVLAAVLISVFGWWKEAGFNSPAPWRNLLLLWFPLLVIFLMFSGGLRPSGTAFFVAAVLVVSLEALGGEMIFRGVMWRALAPGGLIRAVIVTSLLSGGLTLARTMYGPLPEAIYLTVTATCGGFTYAAIRWRTASLWPVIFVHFLLALSIEVAMVRSSIFPYLILATTLGFVIYGLFLLRNRRVREDGGMSAREPARVR